MAQHNFAGTEHSRSGVLPKVAPHGSGTISDVHPDSVPSFEAESPAAVGNADGMKVKAWLIDEVQFSRDCLIRAFSALHPDLCVVPFASVSDCLQTAPGDVDVILYRPHDDESFESVTLQQVVSMRQKFINIPIVVMSDSKDALRPATIRKTLNSGAQGFIPTLTTELTTALTAIRFVTNGGTFVPLNLLLPNKTAQGGAHQTNALPARNLTPRQRTVLRHLKLGKANKIIAFELGMSESTVKVHIRNIMRKMGATNRTQAVYKFEHLHSLHDDISVGSSSADELAYANG
jgi:DNA-binding NarL/FixJ family response regulator